MEDKGETPTVDYFMTGNDDVHGKGHEGAGREEGDIWSHTSGSFWNVQSQFGFPSWPAVSNLYKLR